MATSNFKRVVEELAQLIGFKEPELLIQGGKLRIGECLVTFICDQASEPGHIFVYVDMGPPTVDRKDAYITLLKINFELDSGARGVFSIHPETNRLFYSFRCELNEKASGRSLLDSLLRFVGDAALEGLRLPQEENKVQGVSVAAGKAKASRLFAAMDHGNLPQR